MLSDLALCTVHPTNLYLIHKGHDLNTRNNEVDLLTKQAARTGQATHGISSPDIRAHNRAVIKKYWQNEYDRSKCSKVKYYACIQPAIQPLP